MAITLYGKSFLTLADFSEDEIYYLLNLAHELKHKRQKEIPGGLLQGKNVVLLFEKSSTRTRCAFETGIIEEGGHVTYLDTTSSQFGKKESVEDSAKVWASIYHAIGFRGFSQKTVYDLAKYSNIPVYNGLTDEDHPTQILADLMTIQEELPNKPLSKIKVVFVGDTRNNLSLAWMYGCSKLGMHFVAYGPEELHPNSNNLHIASKYAAQSGAVIEVTDDAECLKNADVIYTDTWVSMGEESQLVQRYELLKNYQVTMETLMKTNNPQVLFMHCLPAFHNMQTQFVKDAFSKYKIDITEVTDEVFNSKHSVVFKEAANRLHTIKAVLVATLNESFQLAKIKSFNNGDTTSQVEV
ncbi:MAG TPA: ornithine carbamoyltransferase [Aquella sp.]|nr:ornithine carbamoyltransferase [Aquella sp.]